MWCALGATKERQWEHVFCTDLPNEIDPGLVESMIIVDAPDPDTIIPDDVYYASLGTVRKRRSPSSDDVGDPGASSSHLGAGSSADPVPAPNRRVRGRGGRQGGRGGSRGQANSMPTVVNRIDARSH
jgi:hypothetical protein